MRILILGNNHVQESLSDYFKRKDDNIVFSNSTCDIPDLNFLNPLDAADFCKANEINFVIPTENEYITEEFENIFNELNITYFAPSESSFKICKYKSSAKKFAYKNKINSAKFFVTEKPQPAFDFIKSASYPITIHPDIKTYTECVKFAETYSQAQNFISKLFLTGNKKIVLEDYIAGKNIVFWALSDGYSAKKTGIVAKYQDNISIFNPDFVTNEIESEIQQRIVEPTILNLSLEQEEYIGIIGFDIILSKDNIPYLIGYKGFFDDLSIDFFLNAYDFDWLDVFESCIKGDVFLKYDFTPSNNHMIAMRENENIDMVSAKMKNNLNKYIEELDMNKNLYMEAMKVWKY